MTEGIYRFVRHPMYSAFFAWGVAQALLLPNWIAGPAGLVGFAILFFGRVGREEQMMIEAFGDQYRALHGRVRAASSRAFIEIRAGSGSVADRAIRPRSHR